MALKQIKQRITRVTPKAKLTVSVVVPVFNEVESVPELHRRISKAMETTQHIWEVVFVDDGSSDGSLQAMEVLAAKDPLHTRVVALRRNFGQTAAISAGLGAMFLLWWVADSYWLLAIFAVIYGSLYGGYVALAPTLCMDLFGARNVAGIIGCLYTAAGFGTLIGPTVAGAAFDAYGSYDAPILGCALLCFAGAALSLALLRVRPAHASA